MLSKRNIGNNLCARYSVNFLRNFDTGKRNPLSSSLKQM
jgi:hypothetical protein